MDRGGPASAVCLGNRIDQQRGRPPSLAPGRWRLVLTFRSPCVARGDAAVNHPTPASQSPLWAMLPRTYTLQSTLLAHARSAPVLSLSGGGPAIPAFFCVPGRWSPLTSLLPVISEFPVRYGGNRAAESGRTIRGPTRIGGDAQIALGRREANKRPRKRCRQHRDLLRRDLSLKTQHSPLWTLKMVD